MSVSVRRDKRAVQQSADGSYIFGYGRASTERQSLTEDAQRTRFETYRKFRMESDAKWKPGPFYYDHAVSAKVPFLQRPQAAAAIVAARPGDMIVAAAFDRVFRDVRDAMDGAAELNNRKIGLVFLDYGGQILDTTTPMGEKFFLDMAVWKQAELKTISFRTCEGLDARLVRKGSRNGKRIGWRQVGRKSEGVLVPDEEMRALCMDVYAKREAGMKWNDILAWYHERNIMSPLYARHPNVLKSVLAAGKKPRLKLETIQSWYKAARDGFPHYYDENKKPVFVPQHDFSLPAV